MYMGTHADNGCVRAQVKEDAHVVDVHALHSDVKSRVVHTVFLHVYIDAGINEHRDVLRAVVHDSSMLQFRRVVQWGVVLQRSNKKRHTYQWVVCRISMNPQHPVVASK